MTSADRRALLEARLRAKGIEAQTSVRIERRQRGADAPVPLSPGQRRMWFLERLHPGTAMHNLVCVLVITGEVNPDQLASALTDVAARHDVLRSRFAADGQSAVVEAPSHFKADFETRAVADPAAEAESIASAPFDLEAAAPWRGRLLQGRRKDEWRLVLVFHHSLMDAWSLDLFLSDLGRAYDGVSLAPPPPIEYSDFAAWQLDRAGTKEENLDVQWWRERLADAPTLDLPTDRPRPAARSGRGATVSFEVDAEVQAGLTSLARESGATLAMVGTTAFAALLARWASQDEVVIGMPVAGRDRTESHEVIGFFVNTLALLINFEGDPTISEAVTRVRRSVVEALGHADAPFERLVEELAPARDLSTPPITQALFTHQSRRSARPPGFTGLEVSLDNAPTGTAKLDLALVLEEGDHGLEGALEYDADLFDATTVERLASHYRRLLAAFASSPQAELGSVALMDAADAAAVAEWSDGGAALVHAGETAASLFQAAVDEAGDQPALMYGSRIVSYAELDTLVQEFAEQLRDVPVRSGDIVGVSWRRSPEAIAALLAAHRVGAAFLPLDPDYPPERLSFMIEDARPAAVLCGPEVDLRWTPEELAGLRGSTEPRAHGAAYVIYTSGSTGQPKGALVGHAGLVGMARAVVARLGLKPTDRVLQFAAHSFDAAVYEIFTTIAARAALVVADAQCLLPGEPLAATLASQEVSVATLPPSALAAMPDASPRELPRLHTMVVAGEACPPDLVRTWAPGRRMWNAYGPTEATVCTTLAQAEAADPRPPALGRPLAGVTTHVLDRRGGPCPIGVVGEIWLGGVTVGHGYLERPELTERNFVDGRYRTGDLGRWRPDGMLEFRGRRDHQVKVRGFRIELGEVAAALHGEPEVTEAVVDVSEDSLVAWVSASVPLEGRELRTRLSERLPSHLVPSRITVVDEMPHLPNGKVDRTALGRMATDRPRHRRSRPVGRSATVAAVFAEVLEIDEVGVEDNFFDLGGHSLLATRLVSRLTAVLGLEVHLRHLFRHPTPAALASALQSESHVTKPARRSEVQPDVRPGEVWPLSPAQRRLWFIHHLDPSSTAYLIPFGMQLKGELDVPRLEQALVSVLERHAVLRTTIREADGEPHAIVGATPAHPLEVVDAPGADPVEVVKELASIAFDLERGPVFRARLARTGPDEAVLAICVHHIVCDGWSTALLVDDLASAWAGLSLSGRRSFGEIAAQQAEADSSEERQRDLDWWAQHLTGMEPAEFPLDRPRPAVPSGHGESVEFDIPVEAAQALNRLARERHTTAFAVVIAAWSAFLRRVGRADDVIVGTPVAGRDDPASEGVVGLFVNTVPLRIDTSGVRAFTELVDRAAGSIRDALIHGDVPFERIVDVLGLERDLSRMPLVPAMLGFHEQPLPELRLEGLDVTEVSFAAKTAKFDLQIDLAPLSDGSLAGLASYSTDVLDAVTVEAWVRSFREVLTRGVRRPDSSLPDLFNDDRRTIQAHAALNAGRATPFPADQSVVGRFLEMADRYSDAIAISDAGGRLSYAELRDRAAAVAASLTAAGVQPGDVVGIQLPRGSQIAVAALGVLGAGAAYLPIDPAHPAGRTRSVLEHCGVKVVLDGDVLELPGANWSQALRAGAALGGEAVAYVMATSGSTGTPKSIAVPHRAVMRLVVNADYAQLGDDSVVATAANPAFDASTFEMWAPLLNGGSMEGLADDVLLDPKRLSTALRDRAVTHLFLTTALFNATIDEAPNAFAALHTLMFGGEAVDPRRVDAVLQADPPGRLLHVYGPTECTTFATWHEVTRVDPGAVTVPIGRPISNTSAWVMDSDGHPVPEGWVGELWLGGPGLAMGYVGEPELTAAKFVVHAGQRAYRTGDLVRLLPGSALAFVGRVDAQVKVRGFRIELTEIEAALRHHPSVSEVAVTAQEDAERGRRLVAHLVPHGAEPAPGPTEIRTFLADRLPDHMVPAVVVALDRLPLTLGGKVDRRALVGTQPLRSHHVHEVVPDEPMSSTESALAAIWRDILGVEDVGLDDNFFDLGGDSILAIRIVARANAAGLGLTPRLAFRHQTVRALAEAAGRPPVESEQGVVTGECLLTPVQLWWLDSDPLEPDHFIQGQRVSLPAQVDRQALAVALEDVAAHHDALRLRFSAGATGWKAWHAAPAQGIFPLLDEVPTVGLGASLNLSDGPTAVAAIDPSGSGDIPNEEATLVIAVHHLCIDAVSWAIVLEDLRTAYEARAAGAAPEFPRKTTAVRDWAQQLRHPEATGPSDSAWWTKVIPTHAPPIPRDHPQDPTWGDLEVREVSLSDHVAESMGRGIGTSSPAEAVLAAVVGGLCSWSDQPGALLTVEHHGRPFDHPGVDLSRTVGWLTALHPLWVEPGLENSARTLNEVPNDGLGFGVERWIRADDDLAALAGPEVSWNHLGSLGADNTGAHAGAFQPHGAYTGPLAHSKMRRGHVLDVTSWVSNGRVAVAVAYSGGTHSAETVESLAAYIASAAEGLVAGPEAFAMSGLEADDLTGLLDRLNAQ